MACWASDRNISCWTLFRQSHLAEKWRLICLVIMCIVFSSVLMFSLISMILSGKPAYVLTFTISLLALIILASYVNEICKDTELRSIRHRAQIAVPGNFSTDNFSPSKPYQGPVIWILNPSDTDTEELEENESTTSIEMPDETCRPKNLKDPRRVRKPLPRTKRFGYVPVVKHFIVSGSQHIKSCYSGSLET